MKNNYICFKCDKVFAVAQVLDTDKPTCDECFKKLLKIKTTNGYQEFIDSPPRRKRGEINEI